MKPDKKFLTNLAAFLVRAKKDTYAKGDQAQKIHEADGSISLIYEEIDWKYHDNYFGGEPFGGREVVSYQGKAVFFMCYYGKVYDSIDDFKPIYDFLQKALSNVSEEYPFRGPSYFEDKEKGGEIEVDSPWYKNDLSYLNTCAGNITEFQGHEEIVIGEERILLYDASYYGGLINLR